MKIEINTQFYKEQSFYLSFVFFVFVLTIITLSFSFPYRAKLFPLMVGLGVFPIIIMDMLGKIFPTIATIIENIQKDKLFDTSKVKKEGIISADTPADVNAVDIRTLAKVFLWVWGFFILFCIFGYLISITVFMFGFLIFFSACRLVTAVEITTIFMLLAWLIFTHILNVPVIW